jgi:hypothetical protein
VAAVKGKLNCLLPYLHEARVAFKFMWNTVVDESFRLREIFSIS